MTLVIMAVCFDDPNRCQADPSWATSKERKSCVIAVCDSLISSDLTSFREMNIAKTQKASWMGRWLIGYSGNSEHFIPVRNAFGRCVSPLAGTGEIELSEVEKQLGIAFRERRISVIEEEILSSLGYNNLQDFVRRGRADLGDHLYGEVVHEVRSYDLDNTAFIVGGFPKHGEQVILDISKESANRARCWLAGSCGAVAIGSGYYQAQWHLNATYNRHLSLSSAIFRILEAKMIADTAVRSVGQETILLLMTRDGAIEQLTQDSLAKVRDLWTKRRVDIPSEITRVFAYEPLAL
jgi:hypothetical protein